jgi:hypothetical protein
VSTETFSREDFAGRVRASFDLSGEGIALTLVDVSERRVSGSWETFSLTFDGPIDHPFGQGTYHLVDEELGPLELFLVPLGPAGGDARYESVFTRAAQLAAQGG